MSAALREPSSVTKRSGPPASYPYQTGTLNGARPSSATLTIATWVSVRNASRSALLIASDIRSFLLVTGSLGCDIRPRPRQPRTGPIVGAPPATIDVGE